MPAGSLLFFDFVSRGAESPGQRGYVVIYRPFRKKLESRPQTVFQIRRCSFPQAAGSRGQGTEAQSACPRASLSFAKDRETGESPSGEVPDRAAYMVAAAA